MTRPGQNGAGQVLAVGRQVTVEVPATSANLGPGFDCFGLALDWRERITLEVIESGYQIDVSGEGADQLPRDESHLVIRSVLTGLADLGWSVPGLRLTSKNTIPHGRGLGSSSAAITAGLLAAAALADPGLGEPGVIPDRRWLLGHANAIEGHPDNVAATINGGFVLAYEGHDGVAVATPTVRPEIGAAVFIPESPVSTKSARGLLPRSVPHGEAAANSGRAALLVHAMTADPDLLYVATRDWLHQGYREPAMPASYELVTSLRSKGYPAVISGAGPTVLVLGVADQLARLTALETPGFRLRTAQVGAAAAVVAVGE